MVKNYFAIYCIPNIPVISVILGYIVMVASFVGLNLSHLTGQFSTQTQPVVVVETPAIAVETNQLQKCPGSCDDSNSCTDDWCNETSSFSCVHTPLDGPNAHCYGSPQTCKTNICLAGNCVVINQDNCCGNGKCELAEGCLKCPKDCGACPLPTPIQTNSPPPSSIPSSSTQSNLSQNISNVTSSTLTPIPTSTQTLLSLNHMTINEFSTRGPNGSYDEFVELYNPTNTDINITNWKLQYKSETGGTWSSKVGSGLTGMIKSNHFFLLASKGYTRSTTPDYLHTANWGFSDTGGNLRIIDADENVVDKVGWGNADNAEGSPAVSIDGNKSLQRKSLFTDTDNNLLDFELISIPTPENSAN